jgi:hypothetical protein
MPADPLARRVYLPSLPDAPLPTRHSPRARLRAAQLARFSGQLQQVGEAHLGGSKGLELWVIDAHDWRRLFRYPYGLPFTRTYPGGVRIVAAADYPARLIARWDPILLRAAQAGHSAPGPVTEFLDLLIGHEWGHGAANLSGLRSRVKWFDEFMATYLFLAALHEVDAELLARFVRWAELHVAGSAVTRADLGAFEYPLVRLGFDNLLWFQGVFTLGAADLLARHGWDFPLSLRRRLEAADRGAVARALVEVAPELKRWFTVFAGEVGNLDLPPSR